MSNNTKLVQNVFTLAGLNIKAKFFDGFEDNCDDEITLIADWQGAGVGYSIQFAGRVFVTNFYKGAGDDFALYQFGDFDNIVLAANAIIAHIKENKTLV